MPTPSQKTPQRIDHMKRLHGEGASTRKMAEEIGVTHKTIRQWLFDCGLKPNGGEKPTAADPDAELEAAREKFTEQALGPSPANFAEVLSDMRQTYARVSAMVRRRINDADMGTATMTEVDKGLKSIDWFATRIRELEPVEVPDPENDPENIKGADEVRSEIEQVIVEAERTIRCVHCRRNPFVRAV